MDIPKNILPEVKSSSEVYGHTQNILSAQNIPIAGIAGDQQAALFGQMCTQPGMVKNTYGTGCFMLMNTGEQPVTSKNNLLTTIAWQINGKTHYALEGSVFIAGAVVQWLRDGLRLIRSSNEIEALAKEVRKQRWCLYGSRICRSWCTLLEPACKGYYRWYNERNHCRTFCESRIGKYCVSNNGCSESNGSRCKYHCKELRVDGGATANDFLMQFQSDILNTKVIRPTVTETTALGAAYLAGLAVGYWKNMEEIQQQWQIDKIFEPG